VHLAAAETIMSAEMHLKPNKVRLSAAELHLRPEEVCLVAFAIMVSSEVGLRPVEVSLLAAEILMRLRLEGMPGGCCDSAACRNSPQA
jgi:hypothetical protein